MSKSGLDTWLRRHVFGVRDGGKCVRFVLRHMAVGKMGSEVLTIDIDGKRTDELVETYAQELQSAAEHDARGFTGVQTYWVQAFYGESDKPVGRCPIRVASSEDEGEMSSEPPTKEGIVTQLMRHNEAIMRTQAMGLGTVIQHMGAMVQRQSEQVEKLVRDKMASIELVEQLLTAKHERDLDMKREEQKAIAIKAGIEKVGALVPLVINKVAGKQALPAANGMDMALRELFSSLSQEQLMTILGQLTEEQQLLITGIAQNYLPKEKQA